MPLLRVLVVEPAGVTADVIVKALHDDAYQVATTPGASTDLIVTAAREHRARVVVLGPSVPRSGLDAAVTAMLAAGARTLVLSDAALDETSSRLLLAGASGFLPVADVAPTELADAVTAVAEGRAALHPDVVAAVLDQWRRQHDGTAGPVQAVTLTAREQEVLQGLADGLTNRMLANSLGVAEKTVEAHRTRLYTKLGARNQAHAVSIALERNLL